MIFLTDVEEEEAATGTRNYVCVVMRTKQSLHRKARVGVCRDLSSPSKRQILFNWILKSRPCKKALTSLNVADQQPHLYHHLKE